ncbi:MAG: hypothetical protein Q7T03_04565 [Deltaproteobacteria bacterium]|nr:hypothetical protein [Deltaproteobacteria bacterium]
MIDQTLFGLSSLGSAQVFCGETLLPATVAIESTQPGLSSFSLAEAVATPAKQLGLILGQGRVRLSGLFKPEHFEILMEGVGTKWGWAFFGFNQYLETFYAMGFLKPRHIRTLIELLACSKGFFFTNVADFFRHNSEFLLNHQLFRATEYRRILEYCRHPKEKVRHAAISLNYQLDLLSLAKSHTMDRKNFEFVFELLSHPEKDVRAEALRILDHLLPVFIKKGWFTRQHFNRMPFEESITCFTSHFDFLIEQGWFQESHYQRCVSILEKDFSSESSARALHLFQRKLPLLLKKGWFTAETLRMILKVWASSDIDSPSGASSFLARQFQLLLPFGMLQEEHVAKLSWWADSFLLTHFQTLKEAGFLNAACFKRFLEASGLSQTAQEALQVLGVSEGWMASPHRWKTLKDILKNDVERDEKKSALLERLLEKLAWEEGESSAEDLASLLTLVDASLPEDMGSMFAIDTPFAERLAMRETALTLKTTAHYLDATDHPKFKAMWLQLKKPGADRLLLDWHLSQMNETWRDYQKIKDPTEMAKKKKALLNFMEQAIKRSVPSPARLFLKKMGQATEEAFIVRLGGGAVRSFFEEHGARFRNTGLYPLLLRASRFMNNEGRQSLRRLVLGLKWERGQFVYPRYEELKAVVSDSFLEGWEKEYRRDVADIGRIDKAEGVETLKKQVQDQVGTHSSLNVLKKPEEIPQEIRALPERIRHWLSEGSAAPEEAKAIQKIFEIHYAAIRTHFGDTFANIRTDLKNYVSGMEKGVRTAEKESCVISGDIEKIARSGNEPVQTCQTLDRKWVNEHGEPIHRMIHGQFKIANWEMDGTIVARRLIEVTVDANGHEHILVERLYSSGGFARVDAFHQVILEYAFSLGIPSDRVHFADQSQSEKIPAPLKNGDNIYRDSFRAEGATLEEIRNARLKRQKIPNRKISVGLRRVS